MSKTAPIYFNVKEARDFLMEHGHVYTIRSERTTGITMARKGNYFKFDVLGKVEIERIKNVISLAFKPELTLFDGGLNEYFDELTPYLKDSGFTSPREWWGAATLPPAKTCVLYRVSFLKSDGDE
jgi:hypothetical protein